MFSRTASTHLQLESQIEESSKGQVTVDQPGSNLASHELSFVAMSDIGSDDTNHEKINSDLDAQHTEAELKESHHKVLALEVELENKNHCCGELEARCLELPLQFESLSKECLDHGNDQKDKPLQTMLAEDGTKSKVLKVSDGDSIATVIPSIIEPLEKILVLNRIKGHDDDSTDVNSLAIVPAKKKLGSGSLWKKILRRKKKSSNKKNTPSL
ncbi:hypothetical protein TanjilG_05573 [Lupinus angustifolius]|uniref:Uncharacterized protein n=1 Tax=Lupinus angustifolius TaxID=3871 RepID=A0A4P1QSJ3_LUPAN|nr:hypothetical protein TanjilG_05573 [Lupinus angustifolius]